MDLNRASKAPGPPEGKARQGARKQHELIDDFIPTIEGKNAIHYPYLKRLPRMLSKSNHDIYLMMRVSS